jgi:hypothetical protein
MLVDCGESQAARIEIGTVPSLLADESLVTSVCLTQVLVRLRWLLKGIEQLLVALWRQRLKRRLRSTDDVLGLHFEHGNDELLEGQPF